MTDKTNKHGTGLALKPGMYCLWHGQIYKLLNSENPLVMLLLNEATNEPEPIGIEEFFRRDLPVGEAPVFAHSQVELIEKLRQTSKQLVVGNDQTLPTEWVEHAQAMIDTVTAVQRYIETGVQQAKVERKKVSRVSLIKAACEIRGLKLSTYYKYASLVRQSHSDAKWIAGKHRRADLNLTRHSEVTEQFLDRCILRFYVRDRDDDLRLPAGNLYKLMESILQRTQGLWVDPDKCANGVPDDLVEELFDKRLPFEAILNNSEKAQLLSPVKLPPISSFRKYLNWYKALPEKAAKLMNPELWERELMVFDTFAATASLPLQFVFADHWRLPFFIVDEETRQVVMELWATVFIDAYSRSVIGFALLPMGPCIEGIQGALQHVIWTKTLPPSCKSIGSWPCFGIPLMLFLDNAWAHLSGSLQSLSRGIGLDGQYNTVTLVLRPPYKGRYGALIERVFGTFAKKFRSLLNSAMKSKARDDVRNAAKKSCLLYEDAVDLFYQLIVEYQNTIHSELNGMTPNEKWAEGMAAGVPLVPPFDKVEQLFWRLYPQTRTLSRHGLRAFGLEYVSEKLTAEPRNKNDGSRIEYSFRYDIFNIGRLAVYRDDVFVCEATAKKFRKPDGTLRQVSLTEWELCKSICRAEGRKNPLNVWIELFEEAKNLENTRQKEKSRIGKGKSKQAKQSSKKALMDTQAMTQALQMLDPEQDDVQATKKLKSFAKPKKK